METKFYVGQKCKSIQLGDCEVIEINGGDYPVRCRNKDGKEEIYNLKGEYSYSDIAPCLYPAESFPFEPPFKERMMEVSDDGISWWNEVVISNINGRFQQKASTGKGVLANWKYAREIASEPSQDEIRQQIIDLGNQMSELTKKLK